MMPTPTIVKLPPPPEEVGQEEDIVADRKQHAVATSTAAAASSTTTGVEDPSEPMSAPAAADAMLTGSNATTGGDSNHNSSSSTTFKETSVATLSSPWQYDDEQLVCSACSVVFTPFNRKHHCRLCGKIYCHSCSPNRALIPPSSIVLVPTGGKKVKPKAFASATTAGTAAGSSEAAFLSFSPDEDPDRMLTYLSSDNKELLYGKGLEERFKLAREPLRVCQPCWRQLQPLQEELRSSNSNAVRFNYVDPTDPRRLFNSPLAFTLGHEIRKAAYTLNNLLPLPKRRMGAVMMGTTSSSTDSDFPFGLTTRGQSELQQCRDTCASISPNLGHLDGIRIPARLLELAKGIAVLTVVKGGFGLAGVEFGTGLAVARLNTSQSQTQSQPQPQSNHPTVSWSAPLAIGTAGMSWGALVGAVVSDHVFLLMTDKAVEMIFSDKSSVQLGADVGVAVGPVGRAVEADFGASPSTGGTTGAPIYTYSMSKGLYAGISLDGKVIVTRDRVNEKFYGCTVTGQDILAGRVPIPPAAQPLYEALARCHVYVSGLSSNSTTATATGSMNSNSNIAGNRSLLRPWHLQQEQQQQQAASNLQAPMPQQQQQQQQQQPYEQILAPPVVDSCRGEYGEVGPEPYPSLHAAAGPAYTQTQQQQHPAPPGTLVVPPIQPDAHSYAGMSDVTYDPGY